jgi:hypothetical protein
MERDYYVQSDPQAFEKAYKAHQDRLTEIEGLIDRIEEIGIAISEQIDARRKPA